MAGKSVEEATEHALDQLGVAAGDAEVIVVSEPKTGLFGRMRVEARVRARVRPVGSAAAPGAFTARRALVPGQPSGRSAIFGRRRRAQRPWRAALGRQRIHHRGGGGGRVGHGNEPLSPAPAQPEQGGRGRDSLEERLEVGAFPGEGSGTKQEAKETVEMAEGMTLEEQGEVGRAFVAGLLERVRYGGVGGVPPAR